MDFFSVFRAAWEQEVESQVKLSWHCVILNGSVEQLGSISFMHFYALWPPANACGPTEWVRVCLCVCVCLHVNFAQSSVKLKALPLEVETLSELIQLPKKKGSPTKMKHQAV